MLNSYVSQPQGLARSDSAAGVIAPEALWIDLIEPTEEEEKLVESTFGVDVPTREEMREIEASNRMYEEAGAIYMTITIVTRLDTDLPESSQITFIMAKDRLITNRYVDPLPFQRFISFAERHPHSCTLLADDPCRTGRGDREPHGGRARARGRGSRSAFERRVHAGDEKALSTHRDT